MPASTFYFLASSVALGTFFLVWAALNDVQGESPWIAAGLIASTMLIAAGVMREVAWRRSRKRRFIDQRRLDLALMAVPVARPELNPDKLTLERNSAFLSEIQRKSDAAKVLSSIPASHREVFELCEEYIGIVDRELPHVAVGSPRLRPLTKGREYASRFHRHHMLRWAEGEARSLAENAATETEPSRIIERAAQVLVSLETASGHYPHEARLQESGSAVRELMATLRARDLIDKAIRARDDGRLDELRSLLSDAETELNSGEQLSDGSNAVFTDLRIELRNLESDTRD